MSAKIFDKVKDYLGFSDEYDEIEEFEEEAISKTDDVSNMFDYANSNSMNANIKQNSKVVSIHSAQSTKVVIIKPTHYNEAVEICDNLKNRKICLINMSSIESSIAQRLLDFIAGASYALGGVLEEVNKGVFVLSPSNVEVSSELKSELKNKGILNWNK
ncbi:cell division protein SepF [Clostridium sediminicola]|uniref:cell division protein SepF n=1 Tax=Clostridium sediminicola TaxID=3114879 RepID=UPI0031F201AA